MANPDHTPQPIEGEGHVLEAAALLAAYLLIGLICLAVCAWVMFSGQFFTMDGLLVIAISLTGGAFFLGIFAWSVHKGEVREILNQFRSGRKASGAHGESSGEGNT